MDVKKKEELLEQTIEYLNTCNYPTDATENQRRVIHKKSETLSVIEGELFYKHKQKGKVRAEH